MRFSKIGNPQFMQINSGDIECFESLDGRRKSDLSKNAFTNGGICEWHSARIRAKTSTVLNIEEKVEYQFVMEQKIYINALDIHKSLSFNCNLSNIVDVFLRSK